MSSSFKQPEEWEWASEEYWSEERWEKELLKNEKMVERYKKVLEETSDQDLRSTLEFYFREQDRDECTDVFSGTDEEEFEEIGEDEVLEEFEEGLEEDSADFCSGLDEIEAYRLGCDFASEIYEYLRGRPEQEEMKHYTESLLINSMKIAANIAGGHGLGYEKETICGNVVKNRWALKNVEQVIHALDCLILEVGPTTELLMFSTKIGVIQRAVVDRIQYLRSQIWW